jgi:hypothetical protein
MSATVRDITTAIVQEIGKRDARIYELELLLDRDRTDTAELADALRATLRCLQWHAERHGVGMDAKAAADARALLARIEVTP